MLSWEHWCNHADNQSDPKGQWYFFFFILHLWPTCLCIKDHLWYRLHYIYKMSAFSYFSHTRWCIKSRIQPCNLHRQTLAVEWLYWRTQWLSTWHRHRMSPFQQVSRQISALLELPLSTVSALIVKWKHLAATTSQPRSARRHKLTERDHLSAVTRKNHLQHSLLTSQTASGSNVSTRTIRQDMKWACMAE